MTPRKQILFALNVVRQDTEQHNVHQKQIQINKETNANVVQKDKVGVSLSSELTLSGLELKSVVYKKS